MLDLDSCLEIAKSATLLAGNFLKEQQDSNLKILTNFSDCLTESFFSMILLATKF